MGEVARLQLSMIDDVAYCVWLIDNNCSSRTLCTLLTILDVLFPWNKTYDADRVWSYTCWCDGHHAHNDVWCDIAIPSPCSMMCGDAQPIQSWLRWAVAGTNDNTISKDKCQCTGWSCCGHSEWWESGVGGATFCTPDWIMCRMAAICVHAFRKESKLMESAKRAFSNGMENMMQTLSAHTPCQWHNGNHSDNDVWFDNTKCGTIVLCDAWPDWPWSRIMLRISAWDYDKW